MAQSPKKQTSLRLLGLSLLLGLALVLPAFSASPPAKTEKTAATKDATPEVAKDYTRVTALDLLKNPPQYLNQDVTFEGTFNSFSGLGLDYKKAFRDSKDYVSFLVRRPDVADHAIPLSELKLIYPRKKSEAVMDLETGDTVRVKGHVFSTALNEPWLDVDNVEVLVRANPDKAKAKKKDSLEE